MLTTDPLSLSCGSFLLGLILGSILYRSDFCMVAMLRDYFLLGHTALLRCFVLYFLVALVLFHAGVMTGLLPLYPPPTFRPASLATIAGGFLFGIGMVLAGGCVVSTLYKMASGNLTNWIAFLGILAGSLLYAEVHPIVYNFAGLTTFTSSVTALPSTPPLQIPLLIAILTGGALLIRHWTRQGRLSVIAYAEGYLQPWKALVTLAVLNFCFYALSGAPMGVTTAYAKMAGFLENTLWPGHVASLRYFMEDSFFLRSGGSIISGGAGPKMDYIVYTEVALVGGVFAGALATALYLREFKISAPPPRRQLLAALAGGLLLGMGARIATGCNVKFFYGGLPLLAWQGLFFAAATIAGSYLGSKILTGYVIKVNDE